MHDKDNDNDSRGHNRGSHTHRLQCRCGQVAGELADTPSALHIVCYCRDCQAYAHHLGQADTVLDALAGTEVVATHARNVSFTQGAEHIACVSLTDKGMLRWYARCCHTPLANTGRDWRMPYVGLVHSSLRSAPRGTDSETLGPPVFRPVQMHHETSGAKGGTPPKLGAWKQARALLGFMPRIAAARLTGSYRRTPFFDGAGVPVAPVQVLTAAEHARAMDAVGAEAPAG
ncbi:DUF6151 family protein [Paracidovorax sp. MALMAid1276]|uniref:DUF6151 family protein n=1 Tax=Paracidovorax sp. MALMAid1276 TaxID=3411631 RepID=UPI003B9CF953